MNAISDFPGHVFAAVEGYCMGGGLDLALACHRRIASQHALFGHRGSSPGTDHRLGRYAEITAADWKNEALEMFVAAVENSRLGSAQDWARGWSLSSIPFDAAIRYPIE